MSATVVDGPVDSPFIRRVLEKAGEEHLLIKRSSVAAAVKFLHNQAREGWSFELDIRHHRRDISRRGLLD